MPAELVKLIARVPLELRDAVKVEAARSRRSMGSIVIEALDTWVVLQTGHDWRTEAHDARD